MSTILQDDEDLKLVTKQCVGTDRFVVNSPEEAEIWLNEYLRRFHSQDESADQ